MEECVWIQIGFSWPDIVVHIQVIESIERSVMIEIRQVDIIYPIWVVKGIACHLSLKLCAVTLAYESRRESYLFCFRI